MSNWCQNKRSDPQTLDFTGFICPRTSLLGKINGFSTFLTRFFSTYSTTWDTFSVSLNTQEMIFLEYRFNHTSKMHKSFKYPNIHDIWTPGSIWMLRKYIKHRRIETEPDRHIFSSQTHEHMTISCVEEIYKNYIKLAKEKTPNLFKEEHYSS